ncbi:DUF885 domain-containing protein [Caulobacter sp. SLTY]|uniref:DUF885 domain-containing protein n=1 Tax=Caulobacter sp. SLTY TaxID=2683262 RepID=UPI003211F41A
MTQLLINRRLALAGLVLAGPLAQVSLGGIAFAQGSEDARFTAFLDAAFDQAIALSPETMTSLGMKTDYGKLDDYTDAGADKGLALSETQLAAMKAQFSYDKLGSQSQISWRLFEQSVAVAKEGVRWRDHGYQATVNGSHAGEIPVFLINQHRVDGVGDAEAYISRLKDTKRVMIEVSASIEKSASKGIVAPAFTFPPVEKDARNVLAGAPFTDGEDVAVWADFKAKVGKLTASQADKDRLLAEGRAALTGPFKEGYEHFLATQKKVQAQAKGNNGAWALPDGEAYYAYRLKVSTTTDMTAEQIHQLGLANLKRVQGEMRAIMAKVGFKGSLQDFFKAIKTDAKYQYPNTDAGKQQYLADAKGYIAQVMAKAPEYFMRLPKAPLEVRAVEEWRQETASVAFYNRPTPDGSRPGIYYVNLADMTQVLKPQAEGIAYHEGAPGHHFQIALAQELQGLPKFRRFGGYGAYIEGWGLYSERLGKEMGFYTDPYSDFGRLSLEAWRAVRLVTDTGLHAKKWTREQSIAFFQENSLLSERDIVKEIERYICWPGQATSYMVGQQKILMLRQKAKAALGGKYDIRAFHDAVLKDGALPLDVLEQQVDAYIAGAK